MPSLWNILNNDLCFFKSFCIFVKFFSHIGSQIFRTFSIIFELSLRSVAISFLSFPFLVFSGTAHACLLNTSITVRIYMTQFAEILVRQSVFTCIYVSDWYHPVWTGSTDLHYRVYVSYKSFLFTQYCNILNCNVIRDWGKHFLCTISMLTLHNFNS